MSKCLTCKKETANPKFCSRSCAAKLNGVLYPKRKAEHKCRVCNESIPATKRFCSVECKKKWKRAYAKEHYYSDEERRIKRCEAVRDWRRRTKIRGVELLGGKCIDCNLVDDPCVYDFHHLDPAQKDFAISTQGRCHSWEKIEAELKKCVLLCSNCHRKRHNKQPVMV